MAPVLIPLALGAAKLGLGTTAAVGGTGLLGAGLSRAALSIPGARNLLGATADQIAQGEDYDLNNPDSYRDDGGDYLRSLFSGVSTDAVKAKAKQQAIRKINQSLEDPYARVRTGYKALGLTAPDISEFQYNEQTGENTAAATYRAGDRIKQLQALQDADALGVDITGLGNASTSKINAAVRQFNKDEVEADRLKLLGEQQAAQFQQNARADRIRNEERTDRLTQQLAQQKINTLQLQNQNAQALRSSQLDNRRLDLQEMQTNLENARTARKDQQLALLTIMQGLTQMGGSIAT